MADARSLSQSTWNPKNISWRILKLSGRNHTWKQCWCLNQGEGRCQLSESDIRLNDSGKTSTDKNSFLLDIAIVPKISRYLLKSHNICLFVFLVIFGILVMGWVFWGWWVYIFGEVYKPIGFWKVADGQDKSCKMLPVVSDQSHKLMWIVNHFHLSIGSIVNSQKGSNLPGVG